MFTRQNGQKITDDNPITPQRVQQYNPSQRVGQYIAPQRIQKKNLHKNNTNNQQTRNNPRQTIYNLRSSSNLPTHPHQVLQHLHTQPIF